jgi:hypothetical protein
MAAPMKDGTRSHIVKRKGKELNRNGMQGIQQNSIVSWIRMMPMKDEK